MLLANDARHMNDREPLPCANLCLPCRSLPDPTTWFSWLSIDANALVNALTTTEVTPQGSGISPRRSVSEVPSAQDIRQARRSARTKRPPSRVGRVFASLALPSESTARAFTHACLTRTPRVPASAS